MRSIIFASAMAVSAAFTPALQPSSPCGLQTRALVSTCNARPLRASATKIQMVSFPFGKGKKDDQAQKKPWGNENPYRVFGVTEDAPYEEVEAAYKELCAENEGNEKYLIKLEMMKEAIFDDRLKARMSGALKSKVKDSPFEAKLIVKKDPWWTKVSWLKNLVKMPEKKYAIQVSALMGVFILAGIAAPQLASTTMGFGFLSGMGFLYNRGTPEIRRDDMGNPGEMRPANYGALGKTVVLCMLGGGLGFMLANVLMANVALPAFFVGDAIVTTMFNLGIWFVALVFQVQDE